MTAEIVVMNREAVVLAADSAVSSEIGAITKTSTSANKLFNLSFNHPVGAMIYGNASFMGLPWETIIKYYRKNILPTSGFNTLEEYANDFLQFLNTENISFPSTAEDEYIFSFIFTLYQRIKNQIDTLIENAVKRGEEITDDKVQALSSEIINSYFNKYSKERKVLSINDSRLVLKKHSRQLEGIKRNIFDRLDLTDELHKLLIKTAVYAFARHFLENVSSGLILAGFGHNDFIPNVKSFNVEGIIFKEQEKEPKEILKYDIDRLRQTDNTGGVVLAFAQADMVQRFMNGVDTNYRYAEINFVSGLCNDFTNKLVRELNRYTDEEKEVIKQQLQNYSGRVVQEFTSNMSKFIDRYFSRPIVKAVSRLPKDELAIMAEALVNLTSLKRKISEEPETVAEPIDVAVITKGDGFIWIKRKHYFQANLNTDYFIKRLQEIINENNANG